MAGVIKTVVWMGVVGTVVGVPAVLIAGPERVGALFSQARGAVTQKIDEAIKDPVALRSQLRSLEAQYPQRIAEVRSDLVDLEDQIAGLTRERQVSGRVVELATNDLESMRSLIGRAEEARASADTYAVVKVRFGGQSVGLEDAYTKANSISDTISAYSAKTADLDRDLGYLTQQRDRLVALLTKLENERAEFQTQLWQLDRQVDAIARNDRMIDLMEKRQRTIDEQSRYRATSLDQIKGRLADIRSKQEAQLESLSRQESTDGYEDRAKFDLDAQGAPTEGVRFRAPRLVQPAPQVIEIQEGDEPSDGDEDSVASAAR